MKKIIYMAVAAIAVLSSCSSDIESISSDTNGKEVLKFTAKMEGSATRATLLNADTDAPTPAWEVGDVISIDGHAYSATTAGTVSDFEGTGATEATHHAYFPASLYNGGTPTLPATQTYTAGKFDMPMYAESTEAELGFKNLCAVLAITVTSEDIPILKSIKVKSDKKMNGSFTVSDDKAVIGDNGTNEVVLTSAEPLTLDENGTIFYIAIPAQNYMYLNIYLSANGETYTRAMGTKVASGIGEIERNQMLNIEYNTNAVKLWRGTSFITDRNIGASSPEDYGGYYAWGGIQNMGSDCYTGSGTLPSNYDTATRLWGDNWRMPTRAEFDALLGNCDVKWTTVNGVNGRKFTGKGDYATNSVFLPSAGYYESGRGIDAKGNYGNYWSSTPNSTEASGLHFDWLGQGGLYDSRENGNSVRAVLAE